MTYPAEIKAYQLCTIGWVAGHCDGSLMGYGGINRRIIVMYISLQWRHNERNGVSNHSLAIDYSIVYSGADQRKHQSFASLAFVCVEFTGDRWIPRTNGQLRGNVSIWWRHHVQQVSCRPGGVGIEKEFRSTFYRVYNYLSMLGLKFICICKRGPVVGYTSVKSYSIPTWNFRRKSKYFA